MEECIQRDLKRLNSVGQQVIRQMYYDYLFQPEIPIVELDCPTCYFVDVDGTLAINTTRPFFAWERVGEDSPNLSVMQLMQQLAQQHQILVLSSRSAICRSQTIDWLNRYNISH
jgi:hypothetical protein